MSIYTALITSQHADKSRFMATVALTTDPFVANQAVLQSLPGAFDLDTAIGVQMDAVGLWAGISRQIKTPLTGVYFAWDTAGVGWDQGYWKRQFDPDQGVTSLLDEPYRLLLRATIALNRWNGQIDTAAAAIAPLFPANAIYIQDNQNKTMTVAVGGPVLDVVSAALLTGGYLALKPATVRINYVFTSAPPAAVFGFDADNAFLGGWDHGAWAQDAPALVGIQLVTEGGLNLLTEDGQVIVA